MWIARDRDGELFMYEQEPQEEPEMWINTGGSYYSLGFKCPLFDFILPNEKVEYVIKKDSSDILKGILKYIEQLNQTIKRIEEKNN